VYDCQVYQDGRPCHDRRIDPLPAFDCDVTWPPGTRSARSAGSR
jgi:hypothetical protein